MHTSYDAPEEVEVGTKIVESVATATGEDPLALDPPLFDVIDAEALDALVSGSGVVVQFEYVGYTVEVGPNGAVTVDGAATEGGGDR